MRAETRYSTIRLSQNKISPTPAISADMYITYRTPLTYERFYIEATTWAVTTISQIELVIDDGDGLRQPRLVRYRTLLWFPEVIRVPRGRRGWFNPILNPSVAKSCWTTFYHPMVNSTGVNILAKNRNYSPMVGENFSLSLFFNHCFAHLFPILLGDFFSLLIWTFCRKICFCKNPKTFPQWSKN